MNALQGFVCWGFRSNQFYVHNTEGFSIALFLECKKGGLVTQRHDEIKYELQDLATRALIPSVVRDEPQIYPGRSADVEETEGMSTPTEERGDLLKRDL